MKTIAVALLALVSFARAAAAHPGVGIVVDAKGNVFYTDLKQVWKVAPDGTQSIAVPNVHTHELWLDPDGTLFGEHLWYEGDATKAWGHRVWKRSANGRVEDVIPATKGFLSNYSFVRDARGNMYWAAVPDGASDAADRVLVRRRAPDGASATLAGGAPRHADGRGPAAGFTAIRWMTAAADGTLHLIDSGTIRRVAPDGTVTTLATLREKPLASLVLADDDRHALMGLVADARGDVYVANFAERRVDKVDRDTGRVSVYARSTAPWAPTGVAVGPTGGVTVLEYAGANARVRPLPTPATR